METEVSYYDTEGQFRAVRSDGPERHPVAVRYRALAARLGGGSVAVFPRPHRYFMPRDFTSNMGYLWHAAWRAGIPRHPPTARRQLELLPLDECALPAHDRN